MDLSTYIDYADLRMNCTKEDITILCETADKNGFAAVCVLPYWVNLAASLLEGKKTNVCTTIGYPQGFSATAAKVEEVKRAIDEDVDELEVVLNICAIKDANWNYLLNDIDSLTRAVHMKGKTVKIIIESHLLTDTEMKKVVESCLKVKPDFINISLKNNNVEEVLQHIQNLKKGLAGDIKIKVSGDFASKEEALALIEAGADRIGSSSAFM